MKFEPRFYSNPDSNHCLQASVMIVLNSLVCNISWGHVNNLTEYDANYYSWAIKGALVISEKVAGTIFFSNMDYQRFADEGETYFKEFNANNPAWFELQKKNASPNFLREQGYAKGFLNARNASFKKISLGKNDIERLLTDNLLITLINAGVLANAVSAAHFVVVYQQSESTFTLHDPGPPPKKAFTVQKNDFMRALQLDTIVVPKGQRVYGVEVDRNDPCPCGALHPDGRPMKYKRCCGM